MNTLIKWAWGLGFLAISYCLARWDVPINAMGNPTTFLSGWFMIASVIIGMAAFWIIGSTFFS
jgi:hypothetical protein